MSIPRRSVCDDEATSRLNIGSSSSSPVNAAQFISVANIPPEIPIKPISTVRRVVRISTHGFVHRTANKGGIGGVCWDDRRNWQLGFLGKIDGVSNLESELWTIYHSIHLDFENNWNNIQLQTSCYEATKIFHLLKPGPSSMKVEIKHGYAALENMHIALNPIDLLDNSVAQRLASMGAEQMDDFRLLFDAPDIIQDLIFEDKLEECSRYISLSDTD